MKLDEFIKASGLKIVFVASKIGTTRTHLSNIIRKSKKPSWRLARDISEFTKGEVTIEEILSGYEEKTA